MSNSNIEVELKWEISETELVALNELLPKIGFVHHSEQKLSDNFFNLKKSELGGYDFFRIRIVNEAKAFFTKKEWKSNGSEKFRLEEETEEETSKADKYLLENIPEATMNKERINWKGTWNEKDCAVSIDKVILNGKERLFLEAEVVIENTTENQSEKLRRDMANWYISELKLKERKEAPSMMELVLESL